MKKNGFSLVELSIVLVIIGIVIGGILIGKSMIATSRNMSVIYDLQKYSSAANNYFTKYGYWPGDDAEATNRWGVGAHNGNGDGLLPDTTVSTDEYFYFWQDLSLADFITGAYTGLAGSVPKTQIPNTYISHYYDGTAPATQQAFFLTNSPSPIVSGASFSLTHNDYLSIDTKMDDGNIATGNVRGSGFLSTDPDAVNFYLWYIYKK